MSGVGIISYYLNLLFLLDFAINLRVTNSQLFKKKKTTKTLFTKILKPSSIMVT